MLGHEHNFELNAMILGVTLKSIVLKFLSIIYLTPTRPALSKTFQDFGFFCDVTIKPFLQPPLCLSNIGGKKSRSCKSKCWRERTDSFSSSYSCVSSGFGSSEEQFLPWESRPTIFQYEADKKNT